MRRILLIDDDPAFLETMQMFLEELNYKITAANTGEEGIAQLQREVPDLIITDLRMPSLTGLDVLSKIKSIDHNVPVIIVTAYGDMDSTIQAMQKEAYDYIEKSMDLERIGAIVKRAIESKKLSEHLDIIINEDSEEFNLKNNFIGNTQEMKDIVKKIGRVSNNRVNVLIQGESGTGKELITKIIHYSGITKNEPFIAVNCTALSESLLESELFGHVKGAFTGAVKDKKGKFELAGEGTIFLDEISEISSNLQVKLLRVLQEREFERVGGETSILMKARLVTASNKNLAQEVAKGKFREDLYYRLNVFTISIPPLRQRREDIPKLVVYFIHKINKELHKKVWKVPYEVMEMLQKHNWVGNVRELENTLKQAIVLAKGDVLEKEYILLKKPEKDPQEIDRSTLSLSEVEREHITKVLESVSWDKVKAAEILGIAKTTLYNKIAVYDLSEAY